MRLGGDLRDIDGEGVHVAAAKRRFRRAARQRLRALPVKRGVNGAEALHGDAGAGQLLRLDVGLVALGQQLGRLLGDDAVLVGVEQQTIEALLLHHRAEAQRLDAAPGEERRACRRAGVVQGRLRGGFA